MKKLITSLLLIIIITFLLYTSLFIVQEGQKGIILRFGKVLRDNNNCPKIYNPGLHFKIPFIENIKNLDAKIQTMENQADRFVTMEKKDLIIDSYIKWKISDFSKYFLTTGGGDIYQAETLLKRKFSDRLRSELGKLKVKGIVTDSRNQLMNDVKESLNYGTSGEHGNDNIKTTKQNNIRYINKNAKIFLTETKQIINPNSMEALGIEVVDVRIKQINLPTEVSEAIYQRMRAEREAVARRHRSQGQEEAEKIRALADYEVTRILSEAEKQSLIIKGEADAETAKLYAKAFNEDPSFYIFLRSLTAYENSFKNKNNLMIVNSKNNFFNFIQDYKE